MSPWSLIILLLVLNSSWCLAARKTKRKDNYRLNVPPPPAPPQQQQQQYHQESSHHPHNHQPEHTSPYKYEDVHRSEYNGHSSHYEHDYITLHSSQGPSGGGGGHGNTYLTDNGLRSIAKGSADQANSAVASQNAAGRQASYLAKNTLAQSAAQAAGTAVAVLKGKEVMLRRLEEQNAESHRSMENELTQLQQAKRSAKAAQYSAQQAINHVSVLTAALNNAQAASELAQKSASEAAAELASQIDMVAQAKTKLELIETQLYSARLDYEETKDAAEKATLSAQEAQLNADDAAVHANVELSESATAVLHHNPHEKIDKPHKRRQ